MTGFPDLPLVNDGNDDNASIHLHSHVGPARPISKPNYEPKIMEILYRNSKRSTEEGESAYESRDINEDFNAFATSYKYADDSGEETQVEDELKPPIRAKQQRAKDRPTRSNTSPIILQPMMLGFIAYIVIMVFGSLFYGIYYKDPKTTSTPAVAQNLAGVNSRIDLVDQRVLALNDFARALGQQVDSMDTKQELFSSGLENKFEHMGKKIESLEKKTESGLPSLQTLQDEFETYKTQIDQIVTSDPEALDSKLSAVAEKLKALSLIETDVDSIKDSVLDKLIQQLPDHVPIFMKDNKIHYLPEFAKFLQSFLDGHAKPGKVPVTWNDFVAQNEESMKEYFQSLVKSSEINSIAKSEFEKIIKNSRNNSTVESHDNVMEDFELGSEPIKQHASTFDLVATTLRGTAENFADYRRNARVLGFLTSTGSDVRQKSFARKVLFGWYDYWWSNGLSSPEVLKFNANNALTNGRRYWQCDSSECSLGIRMTKPIILTDLVVKNPLKFKPEGMILPNSASIYVKPKLAAHVGILREHLQKFRPLFLQIDNNPYLKKFFKIQQVQLDPSAEEQHIRILLGFINLEIPVRDIYIELKSRKGFTGLYNIEAHGLDSVDMLLYEGDANRLIDDDSEVLFNEDLFEYGNEKALGDDDYLLQ